MDGQTGRQTDIGEVVPMCQQAYADTKKGHSLVILEYKL